VWGGCPAGGTTRCGEVSARRLPDDVLTTQEIEALLRVCSRRAPTGRRNRALIVTLWRCGLRISEALALRPRDVDLDQGLLRVQRGKGGRSRVVGVDAGTAAILADWLEVRQARVPRESVPLFCTLAGGSIDASYVRRLLPRLAQRAGVNKRAHPHGLRHAFAIGLDREGAPLTTIRDLLGHQSSATTDIYLRRIGASDAVDLARARVWTLDA
jgi:integrase/recombinase XerD